MPKREASSPKVGTHSRPGANLGHVATVLTPGSTVNERVPSRTGPPVSAAERARQRRQTKGQVNVELDEMDFRMLDDAARRDGLSRPELIRRTLREAGIISSR